MKDEIESAVEEVPGVSVSATVTLRLNSTGAVVDQVIAVGSDLVHVEFTTGTAVAEVTVPVAELTVAGQTLRGSMTFASRSTASGTVVDVVVADASLQFGGVLSATDIDGTLTVRPDGVVADLTVGAIGGGGA